MEIAANSPSTEKRESPLKSLLSITFSTRRIMNRQNRAIGARKNTPILEYTDLIQGDFKARN